MTRKTKYSLTIFFSFLGLCALVILYLFLHNFYAVIPGQVYRSRELSKTEFETVIQKYHIKSVLNLRGAHPKLKWYQQEMDAMRAEHVKHYDIALKSTTLPDIATLKRLVKLIDEAPRPLLIHCESGVDRTGLASVLTLILANDHSLAQIKRQVSIRYFVLKQRSVGKQFLQLYSTWLNDNDLISSRANFFKWLNQLKPGSRYPVFQKLNAVPHRPPLCPT